MAIRVSHTPYGAVGGLAEYAGQAQQAIREQQYAEQEARQAESIAAQERMQAGRIEAGREEWQRKLTVQQEQFATSQAAQQEEMFRRQQASEFATMQQAQVQRAQIATQEQQFEQSVALKEQAFELQRAQETRLLQSAQANIRAQEMRSAFDLTKLERVTDITAAENLKTWEASREFVSPEIYTAGLIAISQGKTPRVPAETSALIEEKRALDIQKKRMAIEGGLTDRERVSAQQAFIDTMGKPAGTFSGFIGGYDKTEIKNKYLNYRVRTGYGNRNAVEQKELDALFDVSIEDYEAEGYFKYYSAWDPKDPDIKQLRTTATSQAATKAKGKINRQTATQYLQQATAANPNAPEQDIRNMARAMAERDGWEF